MVGMRRGLVGCGDPVGGVIWASQRVGRKLEVKLSQVIWTPVSLDCRELSRLVLAELANPRMDPWI